MQQKIVGGWGLAPDPTGGADSAPPDPLAGFKGAYFKARTSKGSGREERKKGKAPKRSMPPGARNPRAATACLR